MYPLLTWQHLLNSNFYRLCIQVVWVGEHRVLTTGFGADRSRQLILRDTRLVVSSFVIMVSAQFVDLLIK